jgi:hypothetical protein
LSFTACKFKSVGWRIRGPFEQIFFDLKREEVASIEATEFKSPVMRGYDFPFLRIRTNQPGPLDNFLICRGGRLSMPRVRKNTQELDRCLRTWLSRGLESA